MRVTVQDALAVGLCVKGQRRFFTAHGLDYRRFVREGFEVEEFGGIEDDNLARTIEAARRREEQERADEQR